MQLTKGNIDKSRRGYGGESVSVRGPLSGFVNDSSLVTVQVGADYEIPLGGSIVP